MLLTLNLSRLVFIDESFCKTGMRREYGWSRRGTRSFGKMPVRSWKTVSLIGAIRLKQRPRLMTHRGPVNGAVFIRFVKRHLLPWLRRGDIVLLDNLNIHKMKRVRELINAAGASVIHLPTYSPELNPIELWWNDLKRELRKLSIDVEADLRSAARRERSRVALAKIRNWFAHSLAEARIN
jgi:transposase